VSEILQKRLAARIQEPLVVFLVGMRLHKPWKVHKWWPIARLLKPMARELETRPQPGFLASETFYGRDIVTLQYWRSWEQLHAWAHDKSGEHVSAWRQFNQKIGFSDDIGLWHETYEIRPGGVETIYHNMPAFGLGRVTELREARGKLKTFEGRLRATD
jgi:hypothetical protein